jgi:peptide/nickel transport system substrate-binding protein
VTQERKGAFNLEISKNLLTNRLDRRQLIGRSAALGAAATVGTAVTSGPSVSAAQDGGSGAVSIALNGDPTLNVFTWPNQLPSILVAKNVFSTLVKYSEEDGITVVPDLATEWAVSDDGLTWTFTLREGVTWHDGEPFTAEDVKFTVDNILNPDVNAQFRNSLAGITETTVVDPQTVTITSEEPLGSLPTILAYNIAIAPKHLLDGQNLNELTEFVQNPVGTGPYRVTEIVPGDRVALEANADYFDGAPSIQSLVYRVIPDINQVVAQLQTGELDMATIEASNRSTLEGSGNVSFTSTLETSTFCIYTNNHRFPFDDATVRKAATMAIDRQLIVDELLLGEAEIATGPYSPAFGDYYNESLQPYPYDTAQAEALMTEAGFAKEEGFWAKEGERVSLELIVDQGNPVREQLAVVVQQFLQDFGFEVNVSVVEWSVYIERGSGNPGDYDTRTGWRFTSPDPDKTSEYGTDGAVNHYGYSNPEADELFKQGRTEIDHEARVDIYHQIQQIIYDDAAIIWMYYPRSIFAYNSRIQNVPEINYRDALLYVYKMESAG